MRFLLASLVCALSAVTSFAADGDKPASYTATVTGVVCGSCKMHITEAFKKLHAEDVHFSRGEKENTQKVTFSSTSNNLSKEDAVKALGDQASRYEVLALSKSE